MRAGHCISSFHEGRCFRNFQICWIHVKKLLVHIRVVLKNAIFEFWFQPTNCPIYNLFSFFLVLRVVTHHPLYIQIGHCILHCNVGVCVTTLKTQNNLSCKLGNFSTKNCGLNAKFEDCIFKDNPNLHTPLQCTVNHGVSIIFWIVCYF